MIAVCGESTERFYHQSQNIFGDTESTFELYIGRCSQQIL